MTISPLSTAIHQSPEEVRPLLQGQHDALVVALHSKPFNRLPEELDPLLPSPPDEPALDFSHSHGDIESGDLLLQQDPPLLVSLHNEEVPLLLSQPDESVLAVTTSEDIEAGAKVRRDDDDDDGDDGTDHNGVLEAVLSAELYQLEHLTVKRVKNRIVLHDQNSNPLFISNAPSGGTTNLIYSLEKLDRSQLDSMSGTEIMNLPDGSCVAIVQMTAKDCGFLFQLLEVDSNGNANPSVTLFYRGSKSDFFKQRLSLYDLTPEVLRKMLQKCGCALEWTCDLVFLTADGKPKELAKITQLIVDDSMDYSSQLPPCVRGSKCVSQAYVSDYSFAREGQDLIRHKGSSLEYSPRHIAPLQSFAVDLIQEKMLEKRQVLVENVTKNVTKSFLLSVKDAMKSFLLSVPFWMKVDVIFIAALGFFTISHSQFALLILAVLHLYQIWKVHV